MAVDFHFQQNIFHPDTTYEQTCKGIWRPHRNQYIIRFRALQSTVINFKLILLSTVFLVPTSIAITELTKLNVGWSLTTDGIKCQKFIRNL